MKLFDEMISRLPAILGVDGRSLPPAPDLWPDSKDMILRADMAYELGGSGEPTPALGATALTDDESLVPGDEILLYGPDLPEIRGDMPYARFAIVRVAKDALGEGNALYGAVKRIEFVRYHVNPLGFMPRISHLAGRESARVSRDALKKGLDFAAVGNKMLSQFHQNPHIEAVRLIFVTDPRADYPGLKAAAAEARRVTEAIDHILKNAMTDCAACSLQKVCEEVEGMRQLHFGLKG